MARLRLSAAGLRGPLDLEPRDAEPAAEAAEAAVSIETMIAETPVAEAAVAETRVAEAAVADRPPRARAADGPWSTSAPPVTADEAAAPVGDDRPTAGDAPPAPNAVEVAPAPDAVEATAAHGVAPPSAATSSAPEPALPDPAATRTAPTTADHDRARPRSPRRRPAEALPAWARTLPADRLRPDALAGRARQTALVLDEAVSRRLDELAGSAGAGATVAALVTATLHFHLPDDAEGAARAVAAHRRTRPETGSLAREERNARLPVGLRDRVDALAAETQALLPEIRRSTLVCALLHAHLPEDGPAAARLVARAAMVRGGAFLF